MIYTLELGLSHYHEALRIQRRLHAHCRASGENALVLTQHYPVITLGYRRPSDQLRLSVAHCAAHGIPVIESERGGGATYHGPGQLVMYPICSSLFQRSGVRDFIARLEEVMCRVSWSFGVAATRHSGLPGIWVGDRKLGALGISVRRKTTFHGCALNVDLDLHPFSYIVPCGLADKGVTSLKKEREQPIRLAEVVQQTRLEFAAVFSTCVEDMPYEWCRVERAAGARALGNDQPPGTAERPRC